MNKIKFLIILLLVNTINYSQVIKTDIFTVNYSEKYEHGLYG